MKEIKVLHADAIRLALENFGDATGFVSIMTTNHLSDWVINGPIDAITSTDNLVGDQVLMLFPVDGIGIGNLIYCAGYNTFGLVTSVEQIYTIPSGIPFAQGYADISALFPTPVAGVLPPSPIPTRTLPPMGNRTATKVSLEAPLENPMTRNSVITFAVATASTLIIPSAISKRGIPNG
jgi:hypothetical protein